MALHGYGLGNDNSMNYGISFSTGLMKNGWAMTPSLGSRKTGDGYVQGTDYEQFNYFFNISKRLKKKTNIFHHDRRTPDPLQAQFSGRSSVQGREEGDKFNPKGQAYAIIRPTVSTQRRA